MTTIDFHILEVGHCVQNERMACRTAPARAGKFPALVALLCHPEHGALLFDTGYAPRFFEVTRVWPERLQAVVTPVTLDPERELSRQLAAFDLTPGDVKTIIISHFHSDHICGLGDFPEARFVCSRAGLDQIRSAGRFGGVVKGLLPGLLPPDFESRAHFVDDMPQRDLPKDLAPFKSGHDILGDGSLLAIALPGHARGQIGLVFRGPDTQPVVLAADGAYSMRAVRENALPTWLAGRLLGHTADYAKTLGRLHALHRNSPHVRIIPAHCNECAGEFSK